MDRSLAHIRRRSQAYWFVDGFSEIAGGMVPTATALIWLASRLWWADSPWIGWVGPLKDMVLVGGCVAAAFAVRWLKGRYTYPRTGQVTYRRLSTRTLGGLIGAVAAATATVFVGSILAFLLAPDFRLWLVTALSPLLIVGCGLAAGLVLLGWALRTGLRRFFYLSGAISLLGIGLAGWSNQSAAPIPVPGSALADPFAPLPASVGHALAIALQQATGYVGGLFAGLGLALIVSGLIVRRLYVSRTTPSAEDSA